MSKKTAEAAIEVANQLGIQAEIHRQGKDENGNPKFSVVLAYDFGIGSGCETAEEALHFLAGFIEL